MASGQQSRSAREATRAQIQEYREVVASAVGMLRSEEMRSTYTSISLEELIDQHLATLNTTRDATKPSRRQRVQKVFDDLVSSIDAIKEVPPAMFRRRDPQSDANTNPDGTDG